MKDRNTNVKENCSIHAYKKLNPLIVQKHVEGILSFCAVSEFLNTKKNCDLNYRRMHYRVIHNSLRDFRTRLRNNQDRHGRKEHINR